MADDILGPYAAMRDMPADAPEEAIQPPKPPVDPKTLGPYAAMMYESSAPADKPGVPQGKSYFDSAFETLSDTASGGKRGIENIVEGVTQGGLQVANAVGINTEAPQARLQALRDERVGMYRQAEERSPIAANIGQIAGGTLAAGVTAGAAGLAGSAVVPNVVSGAAASIAAKAPVLSNILGGVASGAAGSAAMTYGEGEDRQNAALLGGAIGAIPGLIQARGLLAGKLVGNADKVAARAANAEAQGIPISVGQATQNSTLLGLERGLSNVPIVGTKGAFLNQAEKTKSAIDDVANGLIGTNRTQASVNEAFDKLTDAAANSGVVIPLTNTQKGISEVLAKLKADGKVLPNFADADARQLIKTLQEFPEVSGEGFKNLNRSVREGLSAINPKNQASVDIAKTIRDNFKQDISNAAEASGNPGLQQAYQAALQATKDKKVAELGQKMLNKSINPDNNELNAISFVRQLGANKEKLSKLLPAEQMQQVEGLRKVIQTVSRGEKIADSQGTLGQMVVAAVAGHLGWTNPMLAAPMTAGVKGLSEALTSPKTTQLLLKMAKTKANSTAAQKFTNQLIKGLGIDVSVQMNSK